MIFTIPLKLQGQRRNVGLAVYIGGIRSVRLRAPNGSRLMDQCFHALHPYSPNLLRAAAIGTA
jgi:hypothetical protein